MQIFRRLAKNIFFKIVLGIVGLSFVLFGISGFITGMPNSWVLKVGREKISAKAFEKAFNLDTKIIRSVRGNSPEVENYINSEKFKSDVASRLVRKILIQKISTEIGAFGSKKLILETIAKDKNFQTAEGKFDHDKFTQFLQKNGLDEEGYVQEISNEVSAGMIMQTISMTSPVNFKTALEIEEFNQEKRVADIFVINKNNVQNITPPSEEEVTKFYNENKSRFKTKELREVSFLEFDSKNFVDTAPIAEEELQQYYNKNKSIFTIEESKNFYHMIFEDENSANDFLKKINTGLDPQKSNIKDQFVKIAKDFKKTPKDITLEKISQKALPEEISSQISNLKINELSQIVKSKIGFHVFLLNKINPSEEIPFAQVKNKISEKLIAEKKEKSTQESVAKINDNLMIAKNLDEVATKNNLKIVKINSAITIDGQDSLGKEVATIKSLKDFSKNAFASKENQPSKIFNNGEDGKFYALEVNKIIPSRDLELSEVKSSIITEISDKKKESELKKLAEQIQKEIGQNPEQAFIIANKNNLKIERNKTFPRVFYVDLGNSKMPYKNQFLDELFTVKAGKATSAISVAPNEYLIGIVRNIKATKLNGEESIQAKKKAVEIFTSDIMIEYNDYLQKKYPVEVNEKFFGKKS